MPDPERPRPPSTPIGRYTALFVALSELTGDEVLEFREWLASNGDPSPRDHGPAITASDRAAFRHVARRFQRGRRRVPASAWARTLSPEAVAAWAENAPGGSRRFALWRIWGALSEVERRRFIDRVAPGRRDPSGEG